MLSVQTISCKPYIQDWKQDGSYTQWTQKISPSQDIVHSPVSRVTCVWWALAYYKLVKMPGLTENVANCAIWRLRGSLGENTVFFCFFFLLSQTFRLFWWYRQLFTVVFMLVKPLKLLIINMLVKHQTSKIYCCSPWKIVHHLFISFSVSLVQYNGWWWQVHGHKRHT